MIWPFIDIQYIFTQHTTIQVILFKITQYLINGIRFIILLFMETPCKFITAVINLHGVFTNYSIICFITYK